MKIGQAIDMIVKDKNKEFESGKQILYFNKLFNQIFIRDEVNERKYPLEPAYYHNDWKLIQNPVRFMEVVKSNNYFRFEYRSADSFEDLGWCDLIEFFVYMEEEFEEKTMRDILLEGDFYIKEED